MIPFSITIIICHFILIFLIVVPFFSFRFWRCKTCLANSDDANSMDERKGGSYHSRSSDSHDSDFPTDASVTMDSRSRTSSANYSDFNDSVGDAKYVSRVSFAQTMPANGSSNNNSTGNLLKPPPILTKSASTSSMTQRPKVKTPPSPGSNMAPLRRISLIEAARPRNSGKSNSRFLLPDPETAQYSGSTWMFKSKTPRQPKARPPSMKTAPTKHDQTAALMGLLNASGLTMDMLMAMGEDAQRETLIAAATIRNSSRLTDNERLQLRKGQMAAANEELRVSSVKFALSTTNENDESLEAESSPEPRSSDEKEGRRGRDQRDDPDIPEHPEEDEEEEQVEQARPPTPPPSKRNALMDMINNRKARVTIPMVAAPVEAPPSPRREERIEEPPTPDKPSDPRRAMMDMLAKRGGVTAEVEPADPPPDPRAAMMAMLAKRGGGGGEEEAAVPAPVDPRKAMMAMLAKRGGGGEEAAAAEAPAVDPRKAMMAMLAKRGGGEEAAAPAEKAKVGFSDGGSGGDVTVKMKDCRKYGKYFKMLKVGLAVFVSSVVYGVRLMPKMSVNR